MIKYWSVKPALAASCLSACLFTEVSSLSLYQWATICRTAHQLVFSRGHATPPCRVGWYIGTSVCHIFEFRAVLALMLLPNRPRLYCRVSGLVLFVLLCFFFFPLVSFTRRKQTYWQGVKSFKTSFTSSKSKSTNMILLNKLASLMSSKYKFCKWRHDWGRFFEQSSAPFRCFT